MRAARSRRCIENEILVGCETRVWDNWQQLLAEIAKPSAIPPPSYSRLRKLRDSNLLRFQWDMQQWPGLFLLWLQALK